jgi:hypothetical protein
VQCVESQVPYHIAAQGIEFALKAFLRARGDSMSVLHAEVGHSLTNALHRSEAQGLPSIPAPWRAAIAELAPFHQERQFVYRTMPEGAFCDVGPFVDAACGSWTGLHPTLSITSSCTSPATNRLRSRVRPPFAGGVERDVRHRTIKPDRSLAWQAGSWSRNWKPAFPGNTLRIRLRRAQCLGTP